MADNTVDSILIEIEAPADKAKGGLDKIKKSLAAMKAATKDLDVKKLEEVRDVINGIKVSDKAGESMKAMGQGIRSITQSVQSLSKIDTAKLNEITDAISKIGQSLGNLGSNNKINIKIDSEGVKKAVQPLEQATESIQKSVLEPYEQFEAKLQNVGKNFNFGGTGKALESEIAKTEAKLDSLLAKEQKMQTMGTADPNSSAYRNLQYDIAETCNKLDTLYAKQQAEAQAAQNTASAMQHEGTAAQTAANGVNTLTSVQDRAATSANNASTAQRNFDSSMGNQTGANTATAKIQDLINRINQYKATISSMESGKQLFNPEEYERAVQGLQKAQDEFNRFKETVQNGPKSIDDIAKSLQNIGQAAQGTGLQGFGQALQGIASMLPMIQLGGMEASAGFQAMAVGLEALQTAIPIIGLILTAITAIVNAARSIANQVRTAIETTVARIKAAVSKIRAALVGLKTWLGNMFKDIKENLGIQDKSLGSLAKKLQSFVRLFTFMLLRSALTHLFMNIGDSMNLLAQYSDMIGSKFNKNISLMVADIKWLSNSIIAAFEPILNVVAPIIDFLISKLVTAINAINQFFAALTGAKTWTRAKRNIQNYAAGLDKGTGAAKKMKKAIDDLTIGIDELNILRQEDPDDGSGGGASGGGANPAEYFDTEDVDQKWKDWADMLKKAWEDADFTEIGKMIGDKLAEMLANIPWDKIKENARKLGKAIATFINGFIQGEFDGKSVSWWIGHTIAEAINTAFEFVNSFVSNLDWSALGVAFTDLIKGALESLDWPLIYDTLAKLGKGIADFLNSVFRDVKMWEEIGTTISNAINAVVQGAYEFVKNFDFAAFGTAIATGLGNALTGINYIQIGLALTNGINGVFQALYTFAETFPWWEVAFKFATGVNSALANLDWTTIKSGFTSFCKGIGTNLNTAITQINWNLVGKTLGNSINTLLNGIGAFVGQIDFKQIGNDIANFINNAVDTIDWKNAGKTINSIVNGIADLIDAVIKKVDWFKLLSGVGKAMKEIDWDRILATVFEVFAAKWTFKNMFKGVVFGTIGTSIIGGIKDGIDNAFKGIGEWIYNHTAKPIIDGVKKAFGIKDEGKSTEGKSWGGSIIGGFLEGLYFSQTGLGPLKAFIDFIAWVKELFGIHSPSTVFKDIATNVMQGFLDGINAFTGLKEAIGKWAGNVIEWFSKGEDGKGIVEHFQELGTNVANGFQTGISTISEKWESLKNGFSETWTNIKENTSSAWEDVKTNMSTKFTTAKEKVSTLAGNVKEKIETTWSNVKEKTGSAWQNVKETVSEKFTATKENAITTANNLRDRVSTTWDNLKTKTGNIYQNIKEDTITKFTNLKTQVETTAQNLKNALGQRWDEIKKKAADTWLALKTDVSGKFENLRSLLQTTATNIKTYLATTWDNIKTKATTTWQNIKTDVDAKFTSLKTALTTTANNIKSHLETTWNNVKSTAASAWQALKTDVSGKFENLKTSLTTTSNNIKSTLSSAWDSVKSTAATKWGELKTNVTGLYNGLKTTLEGISFTSVGSNIINGIWKGISDGWDWLKKKVKEVADSLLDAAKDALGIESPSKEFAEVGEYVVEGMGKGLETYNTVKNTILNFANAIVSWFKGTGNNDIATRFIGIASDVVNGFKNKVTSTYTTVQAPMLTWAENVRKWFNDASFGGVNTATWLDYAQSVITAFATKITNSHGETKSPTTTWATNLRTWFNNASFGGINNATWTTYALETITGFKDKITSGHVATQSPIVTWATNLKTWFNSSSFGSINNAKWTSYALEVITGFKDKITNGHSATQSPITTWASNLRTWFTSSSHGSVNKSKWESFASDVINGFKDKITNGHSATQGPMQTFANNVKGWFEKPGNTTLVDMFKNIGANIIQGFIDGVNSLWEKAMEKIKSFGESIIAKGKEGTEESSPSRAFREIGAFVVEGFNLGLDDEMQSTFGVMNKWLDGINGALKVSPKISVDTSELSGYTANLGTEFTDAAITHKVQREMSLNSSIQAEMDGGRFSDSMRRVIAEEVAPYLSRIDSSTQRQADKNETVNVEIGRKSITDAVVTQQRADGFNFTPSYA